MVSDKRWVGIIAAVLTVSLCFINACSEKKTEEKIAEKMLKQTTGKDVDVKMEKDKITFEEKGSKTEMAQTSTWPSEMTNDVPRFTKGKIERVVKTQQEGDAWTYNVYLLGITGDDIKNYAGALKEKGWQTSLMQVEGKGGYLNAQKGTMGMNFGFSVEKKDGVLAVYNRP
jgi:hypothetical protein